MQEHIPSRIGEHADDAPTLQPSSPLTPCDIRAQLHTLIDQLPESLLQATFTLLDTTMRLLPTALFTPFF